MVVNDGTLQGWPFVNFGMEVRGTQTTTGPGRATIVYPRRKYTYLVEFFINPAVFETNRVQTDLRQHVQSGRLLATLKSIDHPKTTFKVERLRSYNKSVLVHTATEYQPAAMSFHDDNSSVAMALWREYRAYYQGEGSMGQTAVRTGGVTNLGFSEFRAGNSLVEESVRTEMNTRPSMGATIKANSGRHFFDGIRIYDLGADPDSVNIYTYLYPVITNFDHDNLDYEDRNANMSMTMTFEYEAHYNMIGLNNAPFHDIIEQQLGFRPLTTSPRVPGHARMGAGTANPSSSAGGFVPGISFDGAPLLPNSTVPGLGAGQLSTEEILDIINRTSSLI